MLSMMNQPKLDDEPTKESIGPRNNKAEAYPWADRIKLQRRTSYLISLSIWTDEVEEKLPWVGKNLTVHGPTTCINHKDHSSTFVWALFTNHWAEFKIITYLI